ncbi:MAG: phytanoyl-CoA dioxygenase family protein [Pseudomonadota bacterium]
MPQLEHISRSQPCDDIWAAIDRDGGVIVDDFLSDKLLAQIRVDLTPAIARHRPGAEGGHAFWQNFHGEVTKRITGLAELTPAWGQLLDDPLYKAMGDRYLGEDNYYLNTGQLICIGPGETPQLLHRDELNWPQAAGYDQEVTITAIFALTDFTEDNGATVIAPGSHRWPGATPPVAPEQTCQAVMPAGAALLYSGKVIHGGGANTSSDQWRVGLHAGFVSGWLRAEENHQLTTSLATAQRLSEHAQKMLGFRSYMPPKAARLGMVNYEDAGKLLDPSP